MSNLEIKAKLITGVIIIALAIFYGLKVNKDNKPINFWLIRPQQRNIMKGNFIGVMLGAMGMGLIIDCAIEYFNI